MNIPVFQSKVLLGLVALAVLAGVGVALIPLGDRPAPNIIAKPIPTAVPEATPETIYAFPIQIYHIEAKGNRLAAIPQPIKAKSGDQAIRTALTNLIEQPTKSDRYSAIPANTKVLDFSIQGKEMRLNLSKEFGSGGGANSMTGRVVQVLYTATSIDPSASLYLSVEGKPLKNLGGEGLEIPQPMTRKDFSLEF
jgi:spore germination protein GerM